MSYKQLVDNERKKFAQLTSNLQLINKTFDYEGFETAIRRAVLDLTARTLKPKTGVSGKLVDALITNFHLPESTLLMLVSALCGREKIMNAYETAVKDKYRFFSFGDAMFIQ